MRRVDAGRHDPREEQADEWAEEALIPGAAWDASAARHSPTPMAVLDLAQALQVHPAIVAGRVRYERRKYRLLSQFRRNWRGSPAVSLTLGKAAA